MNPQRPTEQTETRPDPLIDEVRAIRQAIWDQDARDLRRHFERLREVERRHADRLVPPSTDPVSARSP